MPNEKGFHQRAFKKKDKQSVLTLKGSFMVGETKYGLVTIEGFHSCNNNNLHTIKRDVAKDNVIREGHSLDYK